MSGAYYNEFDPFAAAWMRELIKAGHIAPGDVDERSIEDVLPSDLRGYTQHHFFAGIGGWSLALRAAGVGDCEPVWTGSCPCQPFSTAGKGGGFADERHLWPAWHHLIRECGPAVVFGEQVASGAAGEWLDLVQDDLEGLGYAFGAVPFPAAGLGAPHIRDRLYWVADTQRRAAERQRLDMGDAARAAQSQACERQRFRLEPRAGDAVGGLAQSDQEQRGRWQGVQAWCIDDGTHARRLQGHNGLVGFGEAGDVARSTGPLHSFWADADWLFCRDGKWRPVEPSTFPLADGLPARVGRLRGYGNAIVPQAAAAFVRVCLT